jgi:predicted phage-related endonuclease
MLTPQQQAAREGKFTASRAGILMNGDEVALTNLWRELVGDPSYEPENLDDVWAVRLGSCTEQLNLDWFERRKGPVTRRGEVIVHPDHDWAACTLDGWSVDHACPVEGKHVGGREPLDTIIARYQPQMHWLMLVTGAKQCALSVIMGANPPVVEFVRRDPAYEQILWANAQAFMACVWSLTPPVPQAPVAPPVRAETTYDMAGNNAWAVEATLWLECREAATKATAAERALKALVPADAVRCHGYGVAITRNRAGSLALRELSWTQKEGQS